MTQTALCSGQPPTVLYDGPTWPQVNEVRSLGTWNSTSLSITTTATTTSQYDSRLRHPPVLMGVYQTRLGLEIVSRNTPFYADNYIMGYPDYKVNTIRVPGFTPLTNRPGFIKPVRLNFTNTYNPATFTLDYLDSFDGAFRYTFEWYKDNVKQANTTANFISYGAGDYWCVITAYPTAAATNPTFAFQTNVARLNRPQDQYWQSPILSAPVKVEPHPFNPDILRVGKIQALTPTNTVISRWRNVGRADYLWYADGELLDNNSSMLFLTNELKSKDITVQIELTTKSNDSIKLKPGPDLNGRPPICIRKPFIKGSLVRGDTVTADHGVWVSTEPIEFSYRWVLFPDNTIFESDYTKQSIILDERIPDSRQIECYVVAKNKYGQGVGFCDIVMPRTSEQALAKDTTVNVTCIGSVYREIKADDEGGTYEVLTPNSPMCNLIAGNPIDALIAPYIIGNRTPGSRLTAAGVVTSKSPEIWYQWNYRVPGATTEADWVSFSTQPYVDITQSQMGYEIFCEVMYSEMGNAQIYATPIIKITNGHPPAGTWMANTCDGTTLKQVIADGEGGVRENQIPNHPACGYHPPQMTAAPVITGVMTEGETLTATPGVWNNDPVLTYQWQLDEAQVAGATSNTFALPAGCAGKLVSCVVTATNDSDVLDATAYAQERIMASMPAQGTIIGATCEDDTLIQHIADGQGGYTTQSFPTSQACMPAQPPVNTGLPAITGTPRAGETLTFDKGMWTGASVTFTAAIVYNDGNRYPVDPSQPVDRELIDDEAGLEIWYEVTATNAWGSATATSHALRILLDNPAQGTELGSVCQGADLFWIIADGNGGETYELAQRYSQDCNYYGPPVNLTNLGVDGVMQVGETLTAVDGEWSPDADLAYQWIADYTPIVGENGKTLALTGAQKDRTITVQVTAYKNES